LPTLFLLTRAGCCLCEGLEEKLRALDPPLPFSPVDVDADPHLQARFGLEVPVLAVRESAGEGELRPLPRVSPRLTDGRLRRWLEQQGVGG
jgi:hypothetical protein